MKTIFVAGLCAFSFALAGQNSRLTYNIGLILPFQANQPVWSKQNNSITLAVYDYYSGIKYALKGLEKEGFNARFYVFDSEMDSTKLDRVLGHPDLKKMDVIIGPLLESPLEKMEEFCAEHKILLVSPMQYYEPKLKNSTVLNFFIDDTLLLRSNIEKALQTFPNHKYYIVRDTSVAKSSKNSKFIKSVLQEKNCQNYRTVVYGDGKFSPEITRTDSIILVATTSHDKLKTKFAEFIKVKNNSFVLGSPAWFEKSIAAGANNPAKVIYPAVNFKNMADTLVTKYDAYHQKNDVVSNTSNFCYQGIDQMYFIAYGLMTFNKYFIYHLPEAEFRGTINSILIKHNKYGYYNSGIHLLTNTGGTIKEYKP